MQVTSAVTASSSARRQGRGKRHPDRPGVPAETRMQRSCGGVNGMRTKMPCATSDARTAAGEKAPSRPQSMVTKFVAEGSGGQARSRARWRRWSRALQRCGRRWRAGNPDPPARPAAAACATRPHAEMVADLVEGGHELRRGQGIAHPQPRQTVGLWRRLRKPDDAGVRHVERRNGPRGGGVGIGLRQAPEPPPQARRRSSPCTVAASCQLPIGLSGLAK